MAVGAVIARIISQYSDKGTKAAQKDIAKLGKNIDKCGAKAVKAFGLATAASVALAVKLGKDAVKGAMADEKQQAALAVALRNTTGATQEAIDANTRYLDSLELQVAIDNEQLIPALQKLVTATGDLSQAQSLLTLATDVAAASGKDLSTVSTALSRAIQGNFTALTKLGLPLDQAAIKAKDFAAVQKDLAKISQGQAAAAADTFAGRMERLRLRVNQVMDEVGYALIPVLEDLVAYIDSDVIPAIQRWVTVNKNDLAESLRESVKLAGDFAKAALALGEFLVKYKEVFAVLAGLAASLYALAQIRLFIFGLEGAARAVTFLLRQLKLIPPAAGTAGASVAAAGATGAAGMTGLSTVLMTVLKRLGYIGLAVTAFTALFKGLDYLLDKSHKADIKRQAEKTLASKAQTKQILKDFQAVERATSGSTVAEQNKTKEILKGFKSIEKATKAAKKVAKTPVKTPAATRIGNTAEQMEQVQLNAAEALLERQLKINKIDKERVERMKEELLTLKVRNDLASRYQDILKALSDAKIDDKELVILAKLWNVPVEAAKTYIETLFAIEDAKITDDEIIKLAMSWGSTQAQAAQYLDFYQYLNDGFLSDAEIQKLMTKWQMTQDEVLLYADFVGIVNDGKLEDAEIIKIQDKWKLTTDQVVDYIKKIGAPVSYSGTLIDPARAAEIGWLNATAALQRYLDLLKAGAGVVVGGAPGGSTGSNGNDPAVIAAAAAAATAAAAAAADAAAAEAEAAAAVAESEAALAAINSLTRITTASTNEALNEAVQIATILGESATDIANAMMVGLLSQGVDAASAGSSARYTGMAIAAQQAAEAQAKADAEAAARALNSGAIQRAQYADNFDPITGMGYDERFRFNAFNSSGTMATASGISSGNLMAAPVVNITVQGSVTAEQDLVQTIRNGLLAAQYNGDSISLQAI